MTDPKMPLAPILERDDYVEQAYFFRTFRERLQAGLAAQEVLGHLHAEMLSSTRLPYAAQFLATELKHTGLLAPGFARLGHYFTPFQTFVVGQAENERRRFSTITALQVLEGEAHYRAEKPTRPGLFVYEFEAISRNCLGYDDGLISMTQDSFFDDPWRAFIDSVRRSVGEFDFGDLVYFHSALYNIDQSRLNPGQDLPAPLFGEKEGRIAKAAKGHDPLFLFAALQRHLGYPAVPRPIVRDDPLAKLAALQNKVHELEQRLKLVEGEARGRTDMTQFLGKPELLKGLDDE